jgi:hypothetical protein
MVPDKFDQGIIFIPQVAIDPGFGGACLKTGRIQSLFQPVIA